MHVENLDPDQQTAVTSWFTATSRRTYLYAGPGAGKTTTLCHYVCQAVKNGARVIVLAYNVAAEETMISRLHTVGIKCIDNASLVDEHKAPGCAVLTFHKLAHRMLERRGYKGLQTTFQRSLELAARYAHEGFGKWDLVIVDEAQDVTYCHADIIEGLVASSKCRLVAAGDPRQELYSGARWFSQLWMAARDDEKIVLRYNHRSDPRIVHVLNTFSQKNFPRLHCDQIASRNPGNDTPFRIFCITDREILSKVAIYNVGRFIGDEIAKCEPGEGYILAPVTTHKFHLLPARDLARQLLFSRRSGACLSDPTYGDSLSDSYVITTSKKAKGTERERVIVFGCDVNYHYVMSRAQFIRCVFVAISRARDSLVLVIRNSMDDSVLDVMQPILKLAGIQCEPQHLSENDCPRLDIAVAADGLSGGLANTNGICIQSEGRKQTSLTLPLGDTLGDADFVGVYAELLVLHALGMSPVTDVIVRGGDHPGTCISFVNNRCCVTVPHKDVPWYTDLATKAMIETQGLARKNPAYVQAVVMYSMRIGELWTVSSRFEQCNDILHSAAVAIATYLVQYGLTVNQDKVVRTHVPAILHLTRDVLFNVRVVGEVDAVVGGIPVELKFVKEVTDTHRRQASIYAAILKAPFALLLNIRDGSVERVHACDHVEMKHVARATIACRAACAGPYSRYSTKTHRRSPPSFIAEKLSCLIAYSVKNVNGTICAISAIAYDVDARSVLTVFDKSTHETCEDNDLRKCFTTWIDSLPPHHAFLHWGIVTCELIHEGATCLDVMGFIDKHSESLQCAITQYVPWHAYMPHQAFDDALATIIVYLAASKNRQ